MKGEWRVSLKDILYNLYFHSFHHPQVKKKQPTQKITAPNLFYRITDIKSPFFKGFLFRRFGYFLSQIDFFIQI